MTAIEFNHQLLSHEESLFRFAYSLTKNKDDARDLLQETLLKALVYKDHFAEDTNMRAWSFTIMRNAFINGYRLNVRKNTAFDNATELNFHSQNRDTKHILPDSTYAAKELSKIISNLEDMYKVPFVLHTEGFKYKEISEKLNVNLGTVKSRIFFARKKLMNAIEK